jgi:hypothetical protein
VLLSNFTIIYFFSPETKNLALEEVSGVFEHTTPEERNGVEGGSEKHEESSAHAAEIRSSGG